jgi:hypothetical protein
MTLSRISLVISVVLAGQAGLGNAEVTAEELIALADERYAVTDTECQSAGREIVVCAQQNENDRYRLPFQTVIPGDPDNEGVWAERVRLQADPGTCQSSSYFQVDCGSVGIGIGIGFGGDSRPVLGGRRRAGQ